MNTNTQKTAAMHPDLLTRTLWKSLLTGTAAFAISLLCGAQARTWTSSEGAKTFEGELKSYDPATGAVGVTLPTGKSLSFNQSKLSEADILFLLEQGKIEAPSSKPASSGGVISAKSLPDVLPDPDGKEADMSKPVQVFILMGQSNMLGFGNLEQLMGVAGEKYPYLLDAGNNWTVRKDVRNVFFCMGEEKHNVWMSADNRSTIGPEIGIGNVLGQAIDAPVMILKACVGNRALGWDLLPPSAKGTGKDGQSYQGDSEYGNRKVKANHDGWYAGLQYDQDVGSAQDALRNLSTYYPGAKEYQVAGFFWWQGCSEGKGNPETYDKNLAFLFSDLKKDFNAPNAKFVGATLGEHDKSAPLAKKMFDFVDANKDAGFFYAKPVSKGGSCGHYGGDAETYMNVGEGMGKLMVDLLKK